MMIYFFSKRCVPCRKFEPLLSVYKDEKKLNLFKIDCEVSRDISDNFKVTVVPTILFFLNGKLIEDEKSRHTGGCIELFEQSLKNLQAFFMSST